MNRKSGSLRSPQGLTLHTLEWSPDTDPDAVVVIAHGYGEHAGRYAKLAGDLVSRGIAVHALDFSGHGKSAGRAGEVSSFENFVGELLAFVTETRTRWPDLELGLLGHSFGGAVSAALCIRNPQLVDALVLSSPYLRHGKPVPAWQRRLVELLARIAPQTPVEKIEQNALSRIPAEVESYRSDPLVYSGRVSARTAVELMKGSEVIERGRSLTVPMLVIHGDSDRIANPSGSRALVDRAGSRDLTFELVGGGYHELQNDQDGERVRRRMVDWLAVRLLENEGAAS